MRVTLNTDGGVRTGGVKGPDGGKTGRAAIAAVIKDPDGTTIFKEGMLLADRATVNEAEYSAIIFGLYNARELGATAVDVRSDSQLVVNQLMGTWSVKQSHLNDYIAEVRIEADHFDEVTFTWVPRTQNQHAEQNAREILDGHE